MTTSQEIMDECRVTIQNNGYSEDDFLIEYIDKSTMPDPINGQYIIMGEILVEQKSGNKQKTYQTGTGSYWPTELEKDLSNGYF